jgi:hypothetical protein
VPPSLVGSNRTCWNLFAAFAATLSALSSSFTVFPSPFLFERKRF